MTSPSDGPCDWPLILCGTGDESGGTGCSHLDSLSEPLQEVIQTAAVEYLWRWSGRRFGLCSVSLRPCREDCFKNSTWRGWAGVAPGYPASGMYPFIAGGNWFNMICGRCSSERCGCSEISTIVLPGPVNEVTEILIDGEPLDPAAYRLDNLGLSRIDGEAWPSCQNMAHDPEAESPGDASDTFLVTYLQGVAVPSGGQLAAGTLACELAKQSCGDKGCRLPRRASTVQREGVTITLPNDEAFFTNGVTGIFEIDSWLSAVQAENRSGWKVSSPDVKRYRRRW